ncbi:MAG TPA: NAD+ synthase [Flavitalea sp.]|nr:NAD+ synthase [Flavitalea sp.]
MKIALAQQNYHIGNFEENTQKIIEGIDRALAAGAELVVFSELCICGYPPRDFLEFNDFINKCDEAIEKIKGKTEKIGVIIGAPVRNPRKEGKDLFNAGILLHKKEIQGIAQKTLLPTYDVFDEYRYFEPAWSWNVIHFGGKKIALTICEDLWNLSDNPLYRSAPMEQLIKQKPDIMINISASPFDYDHDDDRKEVLRANVNRYKIPLVYCNTVGSQTEVVFDGGSLVFDSAGTIIKEMEYFAEDFALVDTINSMKQARAASGVTIDQLHDLDKEMRVAKVKDPDKIISYLTNENNISQISKALILGIKDYFGKMGFTKAIIGSSGGIDSAVTIVLACKALGRENVRAILMPSQYSTDHSVSDAEQLSKNLGNPYDIIAIKDVYDSFLKTLEPVFKGTSFGIAEENIQSRSRGNLLMSIANKFGYILLNTSNKSELATGYGTLYGDMAGGLGVLGDLYKMQVYALAKFINSEKEVLPQNIIVKPPSAELRPGQKDTDSLPDYSILDKILYQYIEKRQGPNEIIQLGFDEEVVRKTLKLVNTNEYKRNQFCPIIRVSSKAFGIGRRMPIVGKYLS